MTPAAPRLAGAVSSATTDEELLVRVRAGEIDAYGELWRRHVGVALAVAGRFSTVADPEDIVQEAFQAVFTAVRDGGGPARGFRPYLARTVRNVAVSISRRRRAEPVGGLTELADRLDVSVPGHDTQSVDRMVLVQAFQSLPERWRAILWMTVVEDVPVQDAADRLGIAPNAGAALVRRAREGLRRSWLAAHVTDRDPAPECRWVIEHLPLAERGGASARHQDRIDSHTATCQDCARAALEIATVARRLPAVLLPIVLSGGAAAERLLAGVPVAPSGSTPPSSTPPSSTLPAEPSTMPTLIKSLAVAAVVVATAAVVVAGFVLGRDALAGPAQTAASPADGQAVGVEIRSSTVDPDDDPASRRPRPTAGPTSPGETLEPSGPSGASPTAGPLLAPAPLGDAAASPSDAAAVPLTVTGAPASGLREWLPVVTGAGTPGATVEAVLADGTVIGSARVDDGTWSITLDSALEVDVEHEVSVRYQGHDSRVEVGRYTFVAPLVTGVEVVETRQGVHDAVVLVTGTCGQAVEAAVVGRSGAVSVALGACTTRVPVSGLEPGTHTVELRYVDRAQGRSGAVRAVTVTV